MLDRAAEVTVVTAPRERYDREADTVRQLLDEPDPIARVVVVHEQRCSRRAERTIRDLEAAGRVEHVHLHQRAGANECRAAGIERVQTPFVLLLDNDARLEPGSVGPLLARARATGASFVSPLCLNPDGTLHYAGSVVRFTGIDGERHLFEERMHGYGPAREIRPWLEPVPTDAPELHGVLVRRESLARAGGLDVELYAAMDCLDLGLRLQDVDGGGWFEPSAGVVYSKSRPWFWGWPLYFDRWSRATVEHDIARFTASWGLHPATPKLDDHRYSMLRRR